MPLLNSGVAPPRGPSPVPLDAAPGTLNISMILTSFLVFVVISRLPEVMLNSLGTSLRLAFFLCAVCSFLALFSGRLAPTIRRPASIALLVFTAWWVVCIPFSVWPGGSASLLATSWLFGIAAFYIVATGPSSSRHLKLYAGAMAWSAIFVNLVLFRYGVDRDLRGSLAFSSSLSNPNIAALQLLLGFPFLVFRIKTRGIFSITGMVGFAGIAMMIYEIVMRTGSRSGLLILGIMILITLWTTKASIRIVLIATIAVGAMVAIPFVPSYLIARYATILSSASSATDENNEAVASARERQEILKQSIILTLEHPLFGVGPGQFQVAEAAVSKDEGVRAMWLVTHNAYTQLSSETGIPGVILYLTMIGYSLFPVWTDYRKARREKRLETREQFALALLISALGLLVNSAFTSVAYDYYWPILCAMGVAYQRLAVQERPVSIVAAGRSFAPGLRPGQALQRYRAQPERPGTDHLGRPLRS